MVVAKLDRTILSSDQMVEMGRNGLILDNCISSYLSQFSKSDSRVYVLLANYLT